MSSLNEVNGRVTEECRIQESEEKRQEIEKEYSQLSFHSVFCLPTPVFLLRITFRLLRIFHGVDKPRVLTFTCAL